MRFLPFFGHEAAINDIFLVHQKTLALIAAQESEPAHQESYTLWQTIQVIVVLGGLFVLPDQAAPAFNKYKEWTNSAVQTIVSSPTSPPEQRLLAPPVAVEPKEERIGEQE
jgi:hypothetical protein